MQAANLVHAAGESSPGDLPSGTIAVALVVPDEASLWRAAHALRSAHVAHVPIIESNGPYAGQLPAVGVRPGRKEDVGRPLSALPLLK